MRLLVCSSGGRAFGPGCPPGVGGRRGAAGQRRRLGEPSEHLACPGRAAPPAPRPGAPGLSGVGLGSLRGDGPGGVGLCFPPQPRCTLPSSPQPASQLPSPGPVCFSSPEPSTQTHKQPSRLLGAPGAAAQLGRSIATASPPGSGSAGSGGGRRGSGGLPGARSRRGGSGPRRAAKDQGSCSDGHTWLEWRPPSFGRG